MAKSIQKKQPMEKGQAQEKKQPRDKKKKQSKQAKDPKKVPYIHQPTMASRASVKQTAVQQQKSASGDNSKLTTKSKGTGKSLDINLFGKIEKARQKMRDNREAILTKQRQNVQKMTKAEKRAFLLGRKIERNELNEVFVLVNLLWEEFRKLLSSGASGQSRKRKRSAEGIAKDPHFATKNKLIDQILKHLKGHIFETSIRNESSRVLQGILKYGSAQQLNTIYSELKGELFRLSKDVYGYRVVEKLFKYLTGKENRENLFDEIKGKVLHMLTIKKSARIIEDLYMDSKTSKHERQKIVREFYGPSYAIANAEEAKQSIAEFLQANPAKRIPITTAIASAVKKVLSKGLLDLNIVHKLLLDTFEVCENSDVQDCITDLATENGIPYILHTKNGCKTSIYTICYAEAGMRKKIIKSLKTHTMKACDDSFGYLVVTKLLEVTDDTTLSKKIIVKEMTEQLKEVVSSLFGSKIILHLLKPSGKYIDQQRLELLNPSLREIGSAKPDIDTKQIQLSKKNRDQIVREIMEDLAPALWDLVLNNTDTLLKHKNSSLIVCEMMQPEHSIMLYDENHTKQQQLLGNVSKLMLDSDEKILSDKFASKAISKLLLDEKDNKQNPSFTQFMHAKLKGLLVPFVLQQKGGYVVAALLSHPNTMNEVYLEMKDNLEKIKAAVEKEPGAHLVVLKLGDIAAGGRRPVLSEKKEIRAEVILDGNGEDEE